MKVRSYLDPWGGIILEIGGESSHEDTVLKLLAGKRMAEHSAGQVESTVGSNTELRFVFRDHDQTLQSNSDGGGGENERRQVPPVR